MINCRFSSSFLISCWLLFEICTSSAALSASPVELISNFRVSQGLGRVTMDPTLHRIAQEQATAMAARDVLDHDVAGSFSSRVSSLGPLHAAENIAYGYDSFTKTLDQWINSSGHRQNLLMKGASRTGVGSAKSSTTGRTYWALVIAGDYEKLSRAAAKAPPKVKRRGSAATTLSTEYYGPLPLVLHWALTRQHAKRIDGAGPAVQINVSVWGYQ